MSPAVPEPGLSALSSSRGQRVACIGEAMVMLTPDGGRTVEEVDALRQSVGGAEANAARVVSSLGVTAHFVSRLGDDPFGRLIGADLRGAGVDDSLVEIDPDRPTGLYLKAPGSTGSRMYYYRSGSAASAMAAAYFAAPQVSQVLSGAAVVHTSGITAAVLAEPAAMVEALGSARMAGALVSVDVNFRPALWRGRAITPLYELLGIADLVLVGADEARAVFDTDEPDRLRELLDTSATLVVKSDAHAVIASLPDGQTVAVPALRVDVVEPVGAGDAFAGGLLSGLARDLPLESALRLGHVCAAGVLVSDRDQVPPPPAAVRDRLLAADAEEWASVRVGPAGFAAPCLSDLSDEAGARSDAAPAEP
jgi:2-dehydro-3-deoxygluconokinase